jgi:hypothetical protein
MRARRGGARPSGHEMAPPKWGAFLKTHSTHAQQCREGGVCDSDGQIPPLMSESCDALLRLPDDALLSVMGHARFGPLVATRCTCVRLATLALAALRDARWASARALREAVLASAPAAEVLVPWAIERTVSDDVDSIDSALWLGLIRADGLLHHAVSTRAVQLLLDAPLLSGARKSRLDWRDSLGQTALIVAVRAGRHAIVAELCAAGCDLNAKDVDGDSALRYAELAASHGAEGAGLCLAILRAHGVRESSYTTAGLIDRLEDLPDEYVPAFS